MQWLHIGELEVELHHKAIKNLHLSVLPPDGKVRVSAPITMSDTAIRMAVISRIPWIKKQQSAFLNQSRQSIREMVSGECHYVWGKKYRLNIVATSGQHRIEFSHANRLDMYVHAIDYCSLLIVREYDIFNINASIRIIQWRIL